MKRNAGGTKRKKTVFKLPQLRHGAPGCFSLPVGRLASSRHSRDVTAAGPISFFQSASPRLSVGGPAFGFIQRFLSPAWWCVCLYVYIYIYFFFFLEVSVEIWLIKMYEARWRAACTSCRLLCLFVSSILWITPCDNNPPQSPHLLCLPSSFTDLIRCLFLFFSSPPPQLGLGPAGFHLLRYVHPSVDSGAIGVCLRLRRDGAPNLQARLQLPHLRHVLQGPAARRELSPPPMHIFSLEVVTFFAHSSRSSRSNKKIKFSIENSWISTVAFARPPSVWLWATSRKHVCPSHWLHFFPLKCTIH